MLFALVNVTSAESSPPSTPSVGYLQIDNFTGYYMNDTTLSAASVHAAAVAEAGQSNQPALSLNLSSHARRLGVICSDGYLYYDSTKKDNWVWACYPSSPPPSSPPPSPTTTFDFSDPANPGWSVSGNPGFTRNSGRTPSTGTGPSNGVGGSGSYYYVEASYFNTLNSEIAYLSTLAYDGSACASLGLAVTSVRFYYHMYGSSVGTLRLVDAAGQEAWSMTGNQGDAWNEASVSQLFSSSFAFEYYTRGSSSSGDAAVDQVPAAVLRAMHSGIIVV